MKDAELPYKCPKCGAYMPRDYQAEMVAVGNKEYAKPLHSDSLGIMPHQRAEHQQLFPDVKLDNEDRPVFENYKQHDTYLKKTGFRKIRQRIRRKRGKKLTSK